MIYIAIFSITAFFTLLYEKCKKNKWNKLIKLVLALLIILLPSVLGGLRDIKVGTDNINYDRVFKFCYNKDLEFLFSVGHGVSSVADFEKGFVILIWLLSRLGNEFYIFAFGTSLLTFTFVFFSLEYFSKRYSMTVMILAYLFIFYCNCFNYVRQGIALSIVMFGLRYVEKRNPVKFMITVFFAASFHRSAVCAILIYIIFCLVEKFSPYILLTFVMGIFAIIFILGPAFFGRILNYLIQHKVLFTGFARYANMLESTESYFIPKSILGRSLPQVVLFSLFYKKLSISDSKIKGYYIMTWIQLFFTMFGSTFAGLLRISMYFQISEFILLAAIVKYFIRSRSNKCFVYIILGGYLFTYWTVFNVLNFEGFRFPVYPYIFGV